MKKAFDLILSFDDVITHGHRESVTMAQLEAYLEMDSTDEKMFKKMQMIREMEAKEIAKKQQKEIARRKLDPSFRDSQGQKSISSSDIQTNYGVGPAQIGGAAKAITAAPSSTSTQGHWGESETTSSSKKAPSKGM